MWKFAIPGAACGTGSARALGSDCSPTPPRVAAGPQVRNGDLQKKETPAFLFFASHRCGPAVRPLRVGEWVNSPTRGRGLTQCHRPHRGLRISTSSRRPAFALILPRLMRDVRVQYIL